jgi:Mg-chelatase subunit ChlD
MTYGWMDRARARTGSICAAIALFTAGCHRAAAPPPPAPAPPAPPAPTAAPPTPAPAAPTVAPVAAPAPAKPAVGGSGKMGTRKHSGLYALTGPKEVEVRGGTVMGGLVGATSAEPLDDLLDAATPARGASGSGSGYGRGAGGLGGRAGGGGYGGSAPTITYRASPAAPGHLVVADASMARARTGDPAPASPEEPSPRARVGAPGVRAGEWDDNANYREFQRYLKTQGSTRLHPVDVRDRRFLVVRDTAGQAVPRCPVTVADAAGHAVTLVTGPAGRALLFPHAESLTGALTATARCEGAVARAAVGDPEAPVDLRLPVARSLGERHIDVAFVLDTTGSMSEELAAVKATLADVARHAPAGARVRVGLVEFRDRGDAFVTRVRPLTADVAGLARSIADLRAAGGGDMPESVNEALHVAVSQLDWDAGAVARFAFLVGDAPPHLDYPHDADYAVDMRRAAHRGIQVFTVAASGMDALGQAVWRQIAQYTGATNLFILRGGAGPQSAGAGDPVSSCGGRQTRYTSGNLDGLLRGIIDRNLRAVDGNPMEIRGLTKDEVAEECGPQT